MGKFDELRMPVDYAKLGTPWHERCGTHHYAKDPCPVLENGVPMDAPAATSGPALQWIEGRWHCEGRGIHAGSAMDLLLPDGAWLPVRIESRNGGWYLDAYWDDAPSGVVARFSTPKTTIDPEVDRLRWPKRSTR